MKTQRHLTAWDITGLAITWIAAGSISYMIQIDIVVIACIIAAYKISKLIILGKSDD
jgi:hypothetical protein